MSDEKEGLLQGIIKGLVDSGAMDKGTLDKLMLGAELNPETRAIALEAKPFLDHLNQKRDEAAAEEKGKYEKAIEEMQKRVEEAEKAAEEAEAEAAERTESAEAEAAEHAEKAEAAAEESVEEEGETVKELRKDLKERKRGGGSNKNNNKSLSLWIVFWVGLFFHVFMEGPLGFSLAIDTPITMLRIIVYSTLAFILTLGQRDNRGWMLAFLEVFVPIALVYTSGFLGPLLDFILPLWWLTPLFPLYVSYEYSEDSKFYKFWVYFFLIIFFILAIRAVIFMPFFPDIAGQLDVWGSTEVFFGNVWTATIGIWDATREGFGQIPRTLERSLNYATGGYYSGIVEDSQGEPVGIYIEQVRFSNDIHYEGQDVYMWADIRGKSFLEPITVSPSCTTREGIQGEVNPDRFTIFNEGFESVQCKLNHDELQVGSYTVFFTAGFEFETWGDVAYTFVDQELFLNLLSQRHDINRELDVDKILRPIYTPGPVRIGMSSNIPQPVPINPDTGLNTPFGVTLENLWTDGKITRVKEYMFLLPNYFKLEDCDVPPVAEGIPDPMCDTDPDRCPENMRAWVFSLGEEIRTFTSVTCRLRLADGVSPGDVIAPGQQKSQNTFVIKAKYDYALAERRSFGVNDYAFY